MICRHSCTHTVVHTAYLTVRGQVEHPGHVVACAVPHKSRRLIQLVRLRIWCNARVVAMQQQPVRVPAWGPSQVHESSFVSAHYRTHWQFFIPLLLLVCTSVQTHALPSCWSWLVQRDGHDYCYDPTLKSRSVTLKLLGPRRRGKRRQL